MKILYLGIDPPDNSDYFHYPILKIVFRPISAETKKALRESTHFIFTSKNGIRAVCDFLQPKPVFAVGKQTASLVEHFPEVYYPEEETAEGLVHLLDQQSFHDPYFVWPHSALSRTVIPDYLRRRNYRFHDFIAYDTQANIREPRPDVSAFEEIIFTSPSAVTAFVNAFGEPAEHIKLTAIGPVTQQSILLNFLK